MKFLGAPGRRASRRPGAEPLRSQVGSAPAAWCGTARSAASSSARCSWRARPSRKRFCSWWLCLLDVTEQSFMMHHPVTEQPFCLCLAEAILSMSHLACMVSIHPLCPSHRRGWSGSSTRSIPRSRYRSPASSLPHFSPPAPSGLTLQILFFPGWIHCRIAEAEAAGRGVGAEAGGGAQGALRW